MTTKKKAAEEPQVRIQFSKPLSSIYDHSGNPTKNLTQEEKNKAFHRWFWALRKRRPKVNSCNVFLEHPCSTFCGSLCLEEDGWVHDYDQSRRLGQNNQQNGKPILGTAGSLFSQPPLSSPRSTWSLIWLFPEHQSASRYQGSYTIPFPSEKHFPRHIYTTSSSTSVRPVHSRQVLNHWAVS